MKVFEVEFQGYFVTNATDEDDASNAFWEFIKEDCPNIEIDKVNSITEIK